MIGQGREAPEDVGEVRQGVLAVALAGDEQRVEDGRALAGAGMADEEPVLLADGGGPDRVRSNDGKQLRDVEMSHANFKAWDEGRPKRFTKEAVQSVKRGARYIVSPARFYAGWADAQKVKIPEITDYFADVVHSKRQTIFTKESAQKVSWNRHNARHAHEPRGQPKRMYRNGNWTSDCF